MKSRLDRCKHSSIFANPLIYVQNKSIILDNDIKKLLYVMTNKVNENKNTYIKLVSTLDSISPLKTLQRGYSIVENKEKKVVRSVNDINTGDEVNLVFNDGNKYAKII